MAWQVQEAKQRFSEVLRAVHRDGPQKITRHGEVVAVVLDIDEYRRLIAPRRNLVEHLLGPPYFDDEILSVMEEVEADRKRDFLREMELDSDPEV
nr:type II toxin-antitoxin system Phd/YefM family antitoxin [Micromonospora sp. DSM 115978]